MSVFRILCVVFMWMMIAALVAVPSRADVDTDLLAQHGIEPTSDSIRAYLKQFTPTAEQRKAIAKLVGQLGDDDFNTREAASAALGALPVVPREHLTRAAASTDAEVKWRAEKLLERDDAPQRRLLLAVLNSIDRHAAKGLVAELKGAIPYLTTSSLRSAARRAIVTTATPDDRGLLAAMLKDDSATVRVMGVAALSATLGKDAMADVKPLLNDASEHVQLAAARALGDVGDRACIDTFIRLLESKVFEIEWEAEQSLRYLSGRKEPWKFEDEPTDDAERKRLTVEAWKAWTAGEGRTAKLNFPVQISGEIVLFNGQDLTGWQAVHNGQKVRGDDVWTVKDGVIHCNGSTNGYLRTMRSFRDYELTVEWRWPGKAGDSGVWLMISGNDGAQPNCIEAQLYHERAGDFWLIGGFEANANGKRAAGHVRKRAASSEKPIGQWNRMKVRVVRGTVTVHVNDVLQNEATDCQRAPGCIGLQVEGTPIEFRRILLQPLDD